METFRPAAFTKIPPMCPVCHTYMRDTFGGLWTPMAAIGTELRKLQCGHCAAIIVVTDEVWDVVREERRQKIGISDVKPPKREPKERRSRGAG